MAIPLEILVNDEQLLNFALDHICERNSNKVNSVAEVIVFRYIMNNFAKQGKMSFTEAEIHETYSTLIFDHALEGLVKQDLVEAIIDENGEEVCSVTQRGKDKINNGSQMF